MIIRFCARRSATRIFRALVLDLCCAHDRRAGATPAGSAPACPNSCATTPPYSECAVLCGLAALEAALARAFDAADATPLPVEILGVTAQEDWPRLRFVFHPGVALIEIPAAALACYEAAQKEETPELEACGEEARPCSSGARGWMCNTGARTRLEALALREALGGAPFGQICSLLAFGRPEDQPEDLTMTAAGFLLRAGSSKA